MGRSRFPAYFLYGFHEFTAEKTENFGNGVREKWILV